jgi:hypothetical protein
VTSSPSTRGCDERSVAFELSAHDNGSLYFEPGEGAPACPVCRLADRQDWINPSYTAPPRQLDLGYTSDDVPIASHRFVDACRTVEGVRFLELPAAPGWFLMVVDRIVASREHEIARRHVPCPECGRFTQVAGPCPVLLEDPPSGLSRTEWVYGSASDHWDRVILQGPCFVIDQSSWAMLDGAGLTGLSVPSRPLVIASL